MKKLMLTFTLFATLVSCTKESASADKDIRTDFLGSWKCTRNSKLNGSSQFTVTIQKDATNDSRINMFNFNNIGSGNSLYADISTTAANSISIPKQTFTSDDIIGSGNDLSTIKLTFDYTVDDGNAVDTISAIFNKIQ